MLHNKEDLRVELNIKYKISRQFILYVGTVELRKNIPLLIRSFHKLLTKGLKLQLVLIGIHGYGFDQILKIINELSISEDVVILGYVPNEDIIKFYNIAKLFVFPSLYEGFGLPPLEAMACGCPVITSNISSLPEIVGNAGVLMDPYDPDDLSRKMYQILINKTLQNDLQKKGLKQAKKFSWEKSAHETWKIYEKVLEL